MNSHKQTGRIAGILLLIIFALGVTVFQALQGPTLFSDDYLTSTSSQSSQIILSVLLMILSGVLTIAISIIILPIINLHSQRLGYLYLSFCVLNFIAISIDNTSVLSMLELSRAYVNGQSADLASLTTIGNLLFQKHTWTHYLYLLISCLPVFVLFYSMYVNRLVPKALSIFGMLAAIIMFVEMLFTMLGDGVSDNMLLPIALVQVLFPIWLLIKGFASPAVSTDH